ncbi:hypothetical protein A9Q99_17310 [Gammaproteobacteria bacterium 45_16_T64]|nr:hypothetical protein A9Q99_17310 [Gammaproteobacteria bacterium 45_16_T64]
MQARLWFLSQLDSSAVGYEFCFSFAIEGKLDVALFFESFEAVVHRHPGLRTTFETVNGETLQFINPARPVTAVVKDVQDWCRASMQDASKLDALMRKDLIKPFIYDSDLLLRSILYKTGEQSYVWGLCLHHIIADGWTFGLIVDEISAIYKEKLACSSGEPSVEKAAPCDYSHYIEWERVQEADQDHPGFIQREENLHYWIQQLRNCPPLDFSSDFSRPTIRTYTAKRVFFTIPAHVVDELREVAQENGSTLHCSCLTLFTILLYHYTQQTDIAVGTPHANRFDQRFESIAGCFISTLVMRNLLAPESDFIQALKDVTKTAFEAYEHQDYSFEKLISELVDNRDLSRNPLFQVLFVFQNALSGLSLPEVSTRWYPFDPEIGQFELELHLRTEGDSLEGTLIYNSDLYSDGSMTRFANHFQYLAQHVRSRKHMAIREMSLVNSDERNTLLYEWNQDYSLQKEPVDHNRYIAEAFFAQVQKTPENIAIECEQQCISYHALNAEVDRITRLLGSVSGQFIGVMIPRSIDMVAALLAILKAGAAFVPLDPEFPKDRVAYMIDNSGLTTILSHTACQHKITIPSVQVLCVDDLDVRPRGTVGNMEISTDASANPAYLIYTSGSTGKPKGVVVSHRNALNILDSMAKVPGISSEDRWLAVTTLSFDISILELLLPLLNGARVIIATQNVLSDGTQLASLIESSAATLMQATPATWKLLLDSGWKGAPVLRILCGGEALQRDLADALLDKRCKELWNVYGPTETTIWSLLSQVNINGPILLGRPIDNTRCYVLNESLQPVAVGMPGELYIAGDGCSLGYWRRDVANTESFVNLKTLLGVDERAYRTGDLVKYDEHGNLIYLGRKDRQLKVRGYRIEPGEIECALREVAGVTDAAVIDQEGMLLAYVCAAVSQEDIVQYVRQVLPRYMLPHRYYLVEQLPMTPNGKVDRKRLLSAEMMGRQLSVGNVDNIYVAPRTEMEVYVSSLYSQLLNVDRVGREDDFFDLGGHSLLAARVRNAIYCTHSVDIALQTLMSDSSVKALARIIVDEANPSEEETIADLLDRLESMSEEEAAQLLT